MATDGSAPRFSVVVPAYNERDGLPATLDSLAGQEFTGAYEVIVVDNGSDDGTAELARRAGVRVVEEPRRGVCAARQAGTDAARGEIVISTDADTVHPTDWLSRIDRAFSADPGAVAVAGPCRYLDAPWWARIFPPLYFDAIAMVHRISGHVGYLTATNVAFRRAGFPGYDTTLTQGGDEVDLLRRLRQVGRVRWVPDLVVGTSSRRMDQGLAHTLVVSYGYHYAFAYLANRLFERPVLGAAPAIRSAQTAEVRRRRRRWRVVVIAALVGAVTLRRLRSADRRAGGARRAGARLVGGRRAAARRSAGAL